MERGAHLFVRLVVTRKTLCGGECFLGVASLIRARRVGLLVDVFDLLLVLFESELRVLLFSLDEVDPHLALEDLCEVIVQDCQLLHEESLGEEVVRLLGVVNLHEDFKLLFL